MTGITITPEPLNSVLELIPTFHDAAFGGGRFQYVETLARETQLSQEEVESAVRELERRGLVRNDRGIIYRAPAGAQFGGSRWG